jgi:hypothetical protein
MIGREGSADGFCSPSGACREQANIAKNKSRQIKPDNHIRK